MTRNTRRRCALVVVGVASAMLSGRSTAAQNSAAAFTLEQVLDYPFPSNLIAAPQGASIAWTFAERGARNVYAADGPDFKARRLTPYGDDDGQELTNLAFTRDGKTIVYVRGGDHGANWAAEGNLQPNPGSSPVQPRMQVWSVGTTGGAPRMIGEGDEPAVSPDGSRAAFINNKRIWIAPIDGSRPAEQLFFVRGEAQSPRWSPDGRALAFVSDRDDHSFIGVYTDASTPIRYLSPSTSRDSDPVWSADGRTIAFVRMPGRGGAPRSTLRQQPQPWAILTAAADGSSPARELWKSGESLVDSLPRTADDRNLRWAADGRLVFLSYHDGWPHLYSMGTNPRNAPRLLTPGAFAVEHVAMSPDGRFVIYSANAGTDRLDIDRRHVFKVAVDGSAAPLALTRGPGLEWSPVVTGDGQSVAILASDAQRSPLPAVMPMAGGSLRAIAADRVPSAFPAARLVTPEQVVFKSSDGVEVHGQLFKAAAAASSARTPRSPAVVYVHGGPQRQMLLGWHYMDYYANDYGVNQYLASRGFVVLSVNYRLGIGYGHAFHYPEGAGVRGAGEYLDVIAGGRYLQARPDVDPRRIGIWGGSYGGYLTALALGRNSDVFAAGVDIHGVHDRIPAVNTELLARALVGDGISEADYRQVLKVAYESSPIASVGTWKSPVLLIHGDDDRNVQFHQTVDLKRRLLDKRDVQVEELVIPDDIHDFLLWRTWRSVTAAAGEFLERRLMRGTPTSQR